MQSRGKQKRLVAHRFLGYFARGLKHVRVEVKGGVVSLVRVRGIEMDIQAA